jgi:hypothetical protein
MASEMERRAGIETTEDLSHDDEKPTAMKRDEQHVKTLISYVTESMTDHLNVDNHSRQLINISTGLHAKDTIKESLWNVVDTGKCMTHTFLRTSLSDGQHGSFYNPIQSSGLTTFFYFFIILFCLLTIITLAQAAKVMKLHKNIIPFTIKHYFKFHNKSQFFSHQYIY